MEKDIRETWDYYRLSEATQHLRKCYTQGDLFQCLVAGYYHSPPRSVSGRSIHDFSRQARLRLLRDSATIDWAGLGVSQFCTFGYPDECLPRDKRQRSQDRYLWHREMELAQGRQVCGVWRNEWVPRLTGKFVGKLMPHLHIIWMGIGRFPYTRMRTAWREIIKSPVEPNMKFVKLDCVRKCGFYIGKYTAKEPDYKLGNLPNCNKIDGRHYGWFRKELVPTRPVNWFKSLTHEQYIALRDHCAQDAEWLDTHSVKSFSLFAGRKVSAIMKILEMGLTQESVA
jgi:hypothetical protein